MEPITMPALSESSEELTVERWLVGVGERVQLGQPLLTVETDKALMDVESVAEGVLLRVDVQEGQTVEVGTVLAWVGEPGETPPTPEAGDGEAGSA
ncbi:MAG TPA: biotin/lipoyl-containing protein [Solirubrobacteraceae bacterium]|nr:biotin/lipoyl-containing protein [Solirubrobacteraceae bacterium]